jgi:hypothetical protein
VTAIEAFEHEPTATSVWQAVAGAAITDEVLEWPPDLFALTDVVLERSEAYRFAFSPPAGAGWPPARTPGWADAVSEAGRRWAAWVEDRSNGLPELLAEEWLTFRDASEAPLTQFTAGREWRLCVALLTLHAIADEACAGLGVALTASDGTGAVYRARARELLARRGTLARIPPHLIRVLPKIRTSPSGSSSRSLSRYACVHGPAVEARWNKVPGRRAGTEPRDQGASFLLLPWPLRVRESDFRPLEGSVRRHTKEPFGFFHFVPSEPLDLDLVDRTLVAALDEVDSVHAVVLPECAVDHSELQDLEALLHRHGVMGLIAGVRRHPDEPGRPSENWVHIAVSTGDHWVHIRQNKHHRWSLDERQIYQYHLGGALHPHIRWWEASEVPRRSVQFIEVGEGIVVVSLVCEDLAQIDHVAELLRSVGPTIVITPLLDGPQLGSRWAARYASVLADDPGSAVLTLTSAGMAQRSRPLGHDPSSVIALWKDPIRGMREIPLEPGAQGVLLTASTDITIRRSSDGRSPIDNCTEFFDVGVYQVRAAKAVSARSSAPATSAEAVLEGDELTVLMSWAEAIAEALAYAPERIEAVLADPQPGALWRAAFGIPQPSPQLTNAVQTMQQSVRAAMAIPSEPTLEAVLAAVRLSRPDERELEWLAHRVLRSALEQRQIRRTREGGGPADAARAGEREAPKAA